jgi:hypothetical protein
MTHPDADVPRVDRESRLNGSMIGRMACLQATTPVACGHVDAGVGRGGEVVRGGDAHVPSQTHA